MICASCSDGASGPTCSPPTDIADIGNLIGVCVVSGNVRRSAELLIGRIDDKDFINLKNPRAFPERTSGPTTTARPVPAAGAG
jgi:hypothetical protein